MFTQLQLCKSNKIDPVLDTSRLSTDDLVGEIHTLSRSSCISNGNASSTANTHYNSGKSIKKSNGISAQKGRKCTSDERERNRREEGIKF